MMMMMIQNESHHSQILKIIWILPWIWKTIDFSRNFSLLAVKKTKTVINFYLHDTVSAVLATATWVAGWLAFRHMPVLYQNGYT